MKMSRSIEAKVFRSTHSSGFVGFFRNLRFLDALILTSLPLLVFVLLIGDGVIRSSEYAQFDDYWSVAASVRSLVSDRARALAMLPSRIALRRGFAPDASDAGILRLEVPSRIWDKMQGDSQGMWDEWVGAALTYGKTRLDVSLRKRGDNSIHWLTDKRSLTVRTARDQFYKNYRQFALSVKSVLPSYVANRLAQEFDLLAPDTSVVPVYVNNQFYGMFRFLEIVDESFLLAHQRAPGNIYRGDTAERGEAHRGAPRNLFANPYIWDWVLTNDRVATAPPDGLRLMLEDLQGTTFEDHQRLMAHFDLDEYARLFAYLMVVGDPYHSTGVHNEFFYEDPSTQRLHQIPWDIRVRDVNRREGQFNNLFRELLRDPWLTDRILHEAAQSVSDRQIDKVAERLAIEAETKYREYFTYDRLRTGMVPDVGTAEQSIELIRSNVGTIRRWLDSDAIAVGTAQVGSTQVLDFETRGLVGVDLLALDVMPSGRPRLYQDRNFNGVLDADDPELETSIDGPSLILKRPAQLLAAWNSAGGRFEPGRLSYRFFVTGITGGTLQPRMANRITGKSPSTSELGPGETMPAPTAWHPWRYIDRPTVTHRFSGKVHLTETLRIPVGDTVVVAAGTQFQLDPDVSFVSKGVVRFEGTADLPIRIVPAVSGRPWGAFSLVGSGANGSVVRHVEFLEGGGALVDRVEYTGMVNVHRANGVVFDSVLFTRNLRSDDTLHLVHADLKLTNSRFVEANSDALDLDNSTGEISRNIFESSGGNAIDLMASSPRIIGNTIRNAGDKGISVGDASTPFIFANVIENSGTGIQVKDLSSPIILNNDIRSNKIGLGSSIKNWRYGGSGFGFVANTRFQGNATPLKGDSKARLTVVGVDGLGEEAPAPIPLPWLYRRLGVEIAELGLGVPATWRIVTPVQPVSEFRFFDNFASVSDGWAAGGLVTRLEKREGVLVVEAEGGIGSISQGVEWNMDSVAGGMLVLELAGRDIQQIRLEADGRRGKVTRDVAIPADPARFAVVELRLPPDHYNRMTVKLEPTPGLSHIQQTSGLSVIRAGRLFVRSIAAYSLPDDWVGTQAP